MFDLEGELGAELDALARGEDHVVVGVAEDHLVAAAEQVVHVGEAVLVGAGHEEAEVVGLIIGVAGVQRQVGRFSSGWAKVSTQPSLSQVMSTIWAWMVGFSAWRDSGAAGNTWSMLHASGIDWKIEKLTRYFCWALPRKSVISSDGCCRVSTIRSTLARMRWNRPSAAARSCQRQVAAREQLEALVAEVDRVVEVLVDVLAR
jgi:hypothetical protein